LAAALLLVTGLMVGFGSPTSAQDEEEEASHPVHIHSGSCANLGEVVYPLQNIGAGTLAGTPQPASVVGSSSAIPVESSINVVQAAFSDLVGEEYAINAHESDENIQNYIACGDVGGEAYGPDLVFGLAELNNSGYSGVAWLHDNGDGTTNVAVFLTEAEGAAGGEATPAAEAPPAAEESPAAAAPSGEEMAVSIANFAFDPPSLDISAGTTVTWTNNDSTAHTATGDGGTFQSGNIDPGQSFSFTFDTAGTFAYHCEIHPNMVATINVT
jgi:plastocyanin